MRIPQESEPSSRNPYVLAPWEIEILEASTALDPSNESIREYHESLKQRLSQYTRSLFLRPDLSLPSMGAMIENIEERVRFGQSFTLVILGGPGHGKSELAAKMAALVGTMPGVQAHRKNRGQRSSIGRVYYDATMVQGEAGRGRMDTPAQLAESNHYFGLALMKATDSYPYVIADAPSGITATLHGNQEEMENTMRRRFIGRDVGTGVVMDYYSAHPDRTFFIGPVPSPAIRFLFTQNRDDGAFMPIIESYNRLSLSIAYAIRNMEGCTFSQDILDYLQNQDLPDLPEDILREIDIVSSLSEHQHARIPIFLRLQQMNTFVGGAVLNHNLYKFGVPPDHCVFPYIRPDENFYSQHAA